MSELEVRIVYLEPMLVAAAHGFGNNPESDAFRKIEKFATTHNLLDEGKLAGTFGFNNPNPSPGSPNYGYEVWLPVSGDFTIEDDVQIKEVPGGLYAVTRFHGLQNIGDTWQQLVRWQEGSRYKYGSHQWLEHLLTPSGTPVEAYIFDLYLPISE